MNCSYAEIWARVGIYALATRFKAIASLMR
jgi:hypothetical protein